MAKKKDTDSSKSVVFYPVDPKECPFREFKDNELSIEMWGLGPAACRATLMMSGKASKPHIDFIWVDDQTQPLPRSVRQYLHGWVRAEPLALSRWDAEVVVYEESNEVGKMSIIDIQLSHAQVLMRSSFCRRVLSTCFVLERADGLVVEHQWENFMFAIPPEGWRARFHIYSPGMKSGGGQQHRPGVCKSGCYLVRLYYLGAWRCVWVSDQIPVDATGAPLLPFSPLLSHAPIKPGVKSAPTLVTSSVVHLWPLLLCKALLKLAAPDMSSDEDTDCMEDELIPEFNMFHALTGCLDLIYVIPDPDELWKLISSELQVFYWDDDDDTLTSTVKSKSTKKTTTTVTHRSRNCMATITIEDTKDKPTYWLPGITPGHKMSLLVSIARDLPLKKPLPEPEVALWKYYRWIDWARRHGLYESYDCPRTRFLKVNGVMKMSYAPHLLDVASTESITFGFREEQGDEKQAAQTKTKQTNKDAPKSSTNMNQTLKEDLREWIQYDMLQELIENINIAYYPSMFEYASAASNPSIRISKGASNRAVDVPAPKCAPLYLQIDGPEVNILKISLTTLHPRVMINCGVPIEDYVEPAYLFVEQFDLFEDNKGYVMKAFVQTRGYDSLQISFLPGRHYCRLWVHSRLHWHVMMLTESTLVLNTRDVILAAACRECPWATKFLSNLSVSFTNWIRSPKSSTFLTEIEKDFLKAYRPDLTWDEEVVGYNCAFLDWMFRQALQSVLQKRLTFLDYRNVCAVLRTFFCDPEFGLPPKPKPLNSVKEIISNDPCDCILPEAEEVEETDEFISEEQLKVQLDSETIVKPSVMEKLLSAPTRPVFSQVCEYASEDLPCGVLKREMKLVVRKHEAATAIQAYWRGAWARKCLEGRVLVTPDVFKCMMDNAFGNMDSLSALMNEFFLMFPGTKSAYSVASALSGSRGLYHHQGTSVVSPDCKWIPYFQGVFFCHEPVKVHFAVQSTSQYCNVMVYDNDTGNQMPQAYNSHITFDFSPNSQGYTVMGHGTLSKPTGINTEVQWHLSVISSINGAFHVCDNDMYGCKEVPLPGSHKVHIKEMFVPNRRNIIGGLLISVSKLEAISFRTAATNPEIEMVATLRSTSPTGEIEEIAECNGKGEIHWPYIQLQPFVPNDQPQNKKKSASHVNLNSETNPNMGLSTRSLPKTPTKNKALTNKRDTKSMTKLRLTAVELKQYSIEVTAPNGWPLTLTQWKRVIEVGNSIEKTKVEPVKKPVKDKPSSAKDKDKSAPPPNSHYIPQIDDAYIELECSLAIGGGTSARRDDTREQEFAAARRTWELFEPGRNLRGAQIRPVGAHSIFKNLSERLVEVTRDQNSGTYLAQRISIAIQRGNAASMMGTLPTGSGLEHLSLLQEFREEFLEVLAAPTSNNSRSMSTSETYGAGEIEGEETIALSPVQQGPTPATDSGLLNMSEEGEEVATYFSKPDKLKDKFIPFDFLSICMKEKNIYETALLSSDMAEAAKQSRFARLQAGLERMKDLQRYNEEFVLARQIRRCKLLETLSVDYRWSSQLLEAFQEREDAIAQETLIRTLSLTKKKQDQKSKK